MMNGFTRVIEMSVDQVPLFAVKQVVSIDALGKMHAYVAIDPQQWRILDIQGRQAVLVPAS